MLKYKILTIISYTLIVFSVIVIVYNIIEKEPIRASISSILLIVANAFLIWDFNKKIKVAKTKELQ